MSRKTDIFEAVLTNPYNHNSFVDFVREFLNDMDIVAPTQYKKVYNNFSYYVDGYFHIGNYHGDNGEKIAIFSVALKKGDSVERSRTMQRNFIKPLIEAGNCAGALVAFYTPEEPDKWRLSFIRLDYEFSKGKVTEKLTPAKRYSYLVGKGEPCNTAKQRLFPIFQDDTNNPGIDELEEAFSVEKVTNEFFQLYCEKYHELREYLESNEDFMQEAQIRNFTSEQFAKKLLGQIVFLYFIQKKGWLGVDAIPVTMTKKEYKRAFFARGQKSRDIVGSVYAPQEDGSYKVVFEKLRALSNEDEDFLAGIVKGKPWGTGPKDFMRKMFDGCVDAGKNYFDDYLEPLFYTGLNLNRGENGYYPPLHRRIPFLNGGLFEQLDNYEWENNNFNIPNSLFSNVDVKGKREADGILDIFDRYNFTMNEDEPMEREVAIDPEMLGKVFENLLDVKDRKSKGAFYTPREIVHYMCQETLINHLVTKTGISENAIRDFILYGEYFRDEDTAKTLKVTDAPGKSHYEFDKNKDLLISEEILSYKKGVNRLKEIDDLLANVKVADLAVGSGAFPLGMLNEIVRARQVLTEYMAIEMNGFQKKTFYAYERKSYDLKVNTIKNCIFACDIEPSAVDIAKLRLWLSIVIDDEISDDAGNGEFDAHTKPRQLPNLDCNIICGNSLIDEFKGNELITESVLLNNVSNNSQGSIFQSGVDGLIGKLIELQDKLFFTKEHSDKEEIKSEIQKIYDDIVLEQIGGDYELRDAYYESQTESSKPFVLWQLYFPKVFKENGGFDIVIGNPPYVGESGHKEIFRPIAATKFGKRFYQGKMDLFYFFFHKGVDLLHNNGEIALITTNYFQTATGAKNLRNDIKTRCFVRKIINFNEVKVFESALGQHNMITFMTKKSKNDERKIDCIGVQCNGSYVATSNQINNILNGKIEDIIYSQVEQTNLFDGEEAYVRIGGVGSTSTDSVESILDKMLRNSQKLSTFAEVNQGVLTGCDTLTNKHLEKLSKDTCKIKNDGIFVLDLENNRDKEVYNSFSVGKELLKDFYKNSDIEKYYCEKNATKKLIYYTGGISKEKYPDIYKHMCYFRPILEARLRTYNEKYHWTAIHRPRNGKVFEAGVPKIVVPYRTKSNTFAYNEIEWFCRSDCYVITSKNNVLDLKCLLALLNSDTYFFWLYYRGKRKGEVLELFQKPLSEIPIANMSDTIKHELSLLADEIISRKNENRYGNTLDLETQINEIVYKLFGFSGKEIELIKLTGKEK